MGTIILMVLYYEMIGKMMINFRGTYFEQKFKFAPIESLLVINRITTVVSFDKSNANIFVSKCIFATNRYSVLLKKIDWGQKPKEIFIEMPPKKYNYLNCLSALGAFGGIFISIV